MPGAHQSLRPPHPEQELARTWLPPYHTVEGKAGLSTVKVRGQPSQRRLSEERFLGRPWKHVQIRPGLAFT